MKVLHLTRDYPPRSHGGLSSAVAGWVRAHRDAGIEAAVISFDAYRPRGGASAAPESAAHEGVEALRIRTAPAPEDLLDFARRQEANVLHVHDPLLVEPARQLRSALGLPLVVSVHVLQHALVELRGLPEPTRSALAESEAASAADLLTAPSPGALARVHADHPGVDPGRTQVVPLAIEPAVGPEVLRESPPTVLFAGRFADVKGARDFLDAARELAVALPEVRFELAGGLPASPRAERRFVAGHLEAARAHLPDRLRWLGWCEPAALRAAYRRAHVLAAPSWSETFGQCAFEALAHATPLVASEVGAYADYLVHGRECLLVPPRNPGALAAALHTVLTDESHRRALAARGPDTSTAFDPARVGATLRTLYVKALDF